MNGLGRVLPSCFGWFQGLLMRTAKLSRFVCLPRGPRDEVTTYAHRYITTPKGRARPER